MAVIPSPDGVLDLIQAYRRSKTMFVAVSLGLFDQLAKGSEQAAKLATDMGVNSGALAQLLDSCVALGLLKKDGLAYSNSPQAQTYLTRTSPNTLAGYILYSDRVLYPLWGNFESAIREGSNRWQQTFGGSGSIFEHFFRSDESRRDFLGGMDGYGQLSSPAVVAAFDLGRFRRLVDLGGATGHLALAACARYPQLQAAVFDLPAVIAITREYLQRSSDGNRVALIPGDFFVDPLPDADLFVLGRIVHDWSEEKIRRLLKKIGEKLPAAGALLIAEKLLNDHKTGPLPALMQSLSMLVCTEGKERTLGEYTALLQEAGFARVEGRVTGSPLDAILATRA